MTTFNVIDKMPGVYIQEVQTAGAIAGVSTSNVAIVGPAGMGPISEPTLVTNLTQFEEKFGIHLPGPYYASHSVQGFFANGGTSCYFVRTGTAKRASLELDDRSAGPNKTIVVTAKTEGTDGGNIQVEVKDSAPPLGETTAARAETTLAQNVTAADITAGINEITVADVTDFRVDDKILLTGTAGSETLEILRITTSTKTIQFTANLGNEYLVGDSARVADYPNTAEKIRLLDSAGFQAGSYVEIDQGATTVNRIVTLVDSTDHVLTLDQALGSPFTMAAADAAVDVKTLEFDLIATHTLSGAKDEFKQLAMDSRHSRYFAVTFVSDLVEVALFDNPPNVTPPPGNRPAVMAATALTGGADDDLAQLTNAHFTDAIDTLERVDAVNMLCAPDRRNDVVQKYMVAHCEKMQDRFAILDSERGQEPSNGVRTQRDTVSSERGYAALYYPWIYISDPNSDDRIMVPPSGHIAGVFARTDNDKGVHKAPANESITGVLDLERTLTETEAGQLNELSVNVLRRIRNRGFRIWGARTTATGTQWRYVNVRRLLLYIEESIQEGTQSALFEPNNQPLWETLKRQVSDFLTRVWSGGALYGSTPEEAFRVRIDEELNPASVIALGQLVIEVMLRPTAPAEFIVFRIIQDTSRPIVQE